MFKLKQKKRFQRRNGRIQKHKLHRMGRRRSGQDSTLVAPLLSEYAGSHFCDRQ